MKTKDIIICAVTLLGVLLIKDYITNKVNKKKQPKIIVYKKWMNKNG